MFLCATIHENYFLKDMYDYILRTKDHTQMDLKHFFSYDLNYFYSWQTSAAFVMRGS